MLIRTIGISVLLALSLAVSIGVQPTSGQGAPESLTPGHQATWIDSIEVSLTEVYVFPEIAAAMVQLLRGNLNDGIYDEFTSPQAFAGRLTADMQSISNDLHLSIRPLSPEEVERLNSGGESDEDADERALEEARGQNFGFRRVEILDGNVGYLRLDGFQHAEYAGPTAVAALNFLAHCDALIIDLRENGGGSPSMIQLISSYFFEGPVHLNSFYVRKTGETMEFWTHAEVEGPRMVDTDLYVLTSENTFSAAEEFAYNLKNMERATIVGETTGGGAHPIEQPVFPAQGFAMSLPFGRAINPITGTNWEGTGVAPDIECAVAEALDEAHLAALDKLWQRASMAEEGRYTWAMMGIRHKTDGSPVDTAALAHYVGTYGDRTVTMQDGELYYQRMRDPMHMIPMSETLFRFDEVDWFRLEVVLDPEGQAIKIIGHYANGGYDESPRTTE